MSSAVSELWDLLYKDRAERRGASAVSDWLVPSAAVMILRWAAFVESEKAAIAAFDDTAYSPALPPDLQVDSWRDKSGLAARLVRGTACVRPRHDIPSVKYVSAVADIVRTCLERSPDLFEGIVATVGAVAFDTPEGRDHAASLFDGLLQRVVEMEGRDIGQFTTPQPIVDLMVELADPHPGDRIYDPCFGTAGFLTAAGRRIRHSALLSSLSRADRNSGGIFGVEINPSAFVIGLCRVVLSGIDVPGLELGDALERQLPRNRAAEGFDCIIASPPWGARTSATKPLQYLVPTRDAANLFLQHIIANLRPSGRAVVVLPEGMLFRTGADRQIRKILLTEFRVQGVISLPEGAFAPSTGIASSILVLSRDKPASSVRFIRARLPQDRPIDSRGLDEPWMIARSLRGNISELPLEWVEKSGLASTRLADRIWEVPVSALVARDYELVAKHTGEEELEATLNRLRAIDSALEVTPLDQIAEVFQGASYDKEITTDRNSELLVGLVRVGDVGLTLKAPSLFFSPAANERVRDELRLRSGDILLTTSGSVGKIALVDDTPSFGGAVPTKSLVVIRCRERVVPRYVATLLRSPAYGNWIAGHARGAVIQHLSVRTLRKLPILVAPLQVQDSAVRRASEEMGRDGLAILEKVITRAPFGSDGQLARARESH